MVKMSEDSWKLEKDLCRCCHSEGAFKNLSETCPDDGLEVYSDMLQFALNINMSPVAGVLCFVTYTICEQCIDRLRDAVNFKRQVQQCEDRFRDMYDRDIIKVGDSNVKLKQESPELDAEVADKNTDFPHMDTDDSDNFPLNYEADNRSETDVKKEVISKSKSKKTKPKQTKSKKKTEQTKKNESGDAGKKDYKARYFQGEKAYSCNYCAEQCSFAKDMQNHVKVHKINKCPLCDEKYGENKNKADHLLKEHGVEEIVDEDGNVVQTHTCTVCWKKYKKRSQYNSHITVHRPVKCRKCFLQFDRDEIPQNLKEVHNDMSLTCGICGYQVYKNSLLLRHQRRVHLNERNLTCHICNMELFANGDLKKHLVKHNPVKIFECAHCQKKYPRRTTLVQHLKIHMGDKKVCPICEQRFVQKASLNYHMIKYHPETC